MIQQIDHGDYSNKIYALFMLEEMERRNSEFYLPHNTNKTSRDMIMNTLLKQYKDKKNPK